MITFIPMSNSYRYNTNISVLNTPVNFEFRWNRRTSSYFINAYIPTTGENLISNKTIGANGYLEFNQNSVGLLGCLQLIQISKGRAPSFDNWMQNYALILSTPPILDT